MNYRKFGDPPNRGEINIPKPRRPIPPREVALPGTKALDTSAEASPGLVLKPRSQPPGSDFYPQARALGVLAVVLAITALAVTLINTFFDVGENTAWLVFVGVISFFLVHILGIISETISRSRNSLGLGAILLLWGGFLLLVAIAIVRRWLSADA
jgi:hypothetical protein